MSNPWKDTLTDKEFYMGVSRFVDTKPETIRMYWEAFYEFIVRELFFKGKCRLPLFGNFDTVYYEEQIQRQKVNEEVRLYKVPERIIPRFEPHDEMINDVNMQGVTKKYRRRLKNGTLTSRDYMRQIRANSVNAKGILSEDQVESAKENFKELLKKKKKEKEDVIKALEEVKE